jgi:hypothetical protein
MPELIHLGGKVFSSKSKAEAFVRSINDAHVPGEFLTGEEDAAIRAALQRHPGCAEKVGLGIRRIGIFGNGDTRSGHGFGVERVDGTIARFSYRNCFDANRRENRDRVSEAFRQAVRSAVLKWRDNTVTKHEGRMLCPIARTPIDPKRCHVDHTSPSFAELVKEFLSTEGLEIDEVGVEISDGSQVEAVISDIEIRNRWIQFHNRKVSLRIVSVEGHRIHHGNITANE